MEKFEQKFEQFVEKLGDFIAGHKKEIGFGLLILAGVIGLFFSGQIWMKNREEKALAKMYTLQKKADDLALEDQSLGILTKIDPEKAAPLIASYQEAVAKYGDSEAGRFMRYQLASLLTKTGQHDAAIKELIAFKDLFQLRSPYRSLALAQAAFNAIELKQFEQAKTYLTESDALGEKNPQREFVLYLSGKAEEGLGNPSAALKHYEKLNKDFERSPLLLLAKNRIAVLAPEVGKTGEDFPKLELDGQKQSAAPVGQTAP